MADCYYHGYSGSPGPCSQCEKESREELERGSILIDPDTIKARIEMSQREEKLNELRRMSRTGRGR